MSGRSQILTRAINQDHIHGAQECLSSLAVMEQASRKIEAIPKAFQDSADVVQKTTRAHS